MQYVNRYDIAPGKAVEFRSWLDENSAELAAGAPEGWSYLGTWFTVLGFGQYQCETRWEVDTYASLGESFGTSDNQRLLVEWFDFIDNASSGETYLLKSTGDVQIIEGS